MPVTPRVLHTCIHSMTVNVDFYVKSWQLIANI